MNTWKSSLILQLKTLQRKLKWPRTFRASVRGVVKTFPIQEGGAQQTAEMNLHDTQSK